MIFAAVAAFGFAGEKKADYYQPLYSEPLAAKPLTDPVSRFLELPFLLVKWPMDQMLVMTEKYRLERKTQWVFDKMGEYGFRPRLDSLDFSAAPSFGADIDFVKLFRKKVDLPDLLATGWINYGPTSYFQVGGKVGVERIGGTGLYTSLSSQYENRRNETFYGIGPRTSFGDSTSYIKETTSIGTTVGYKASPVLDFAAKIAYNHVNIKNRAHDGKGDINTIFANKNIPGKNGDDLLKFSFGITRDTRDSKEDATKGSYQKFLLGYTEGVDSSKARYFTYQIDAAKYLKLGSPRRVLAGRFFGEFNQAIDGGDVPFYEMTKLGGSGVFPRFGQAHRGFVYNRFSGESALLLSLEYRYTVWQHKEFKLKTVFFVDEGTVSRDSASFRFSDFRESYGIGFHLIYSQNVLLNFSVAHSDEGTQFYIENTVPF